MEQNHSLKVPQTEVVRESPENGDGSLKDTPLTEGVLGKEREK